MNVVKPLISAHRWLTPANGLSLLAGTWLLACVPAMANPSNNFGPILMAQGLPADVSLQFGSSGPEVVQLQQALNSNGLFPYSIDGVYGDDTRHAVRQFQRIRRLEVTGLADVETLQALGVDPTSLLPRMVHPVHGALGTDELGPGAARSADVAVLQSALNSFGFGLTTDGVYGDSTRRAVRAYQRTAGILQPNGDVSGIADRETLASMGFELTGNFEEENRYVAAIIAGESDLSSVRQDFPEAVLDSSRLGEYISLGRYEKRSQADAKADLARSYGYDSRVLRD